MKVIERKAGVEKKKQWEISIQMLILKVEGKVTELMATRIKF